MNLEELFGSHPLMKQLLKSPLYYQDIHLGMKRGMDPFEIIRIYEDYFRETGQKSYKDFGNQSVSLKDWE